MTIFLILLTVITERFETLLSPNTPLRFAVSLLLAYGLILLQFIGLVLVEASLTSKRPIARLARDSNVCTYARRDGHEVGAFFSTTVCHGRSRALVTSLADIPLRHSTGQVRDDVIMAVNFVVQQINPLFVCDFSLENNIFAIKTTIDNYFVLCIVILETPDLRDPTTILQIDTRRL